MLSNLSLIRLKCACIFVFFPSFSISVFLSFHRIYYKKFSSTLWLLESGNDGVPVGPIYPFTITLTHIYNTKTLWWIKREKRSSNKVWIHYNVDPCNIVIDNVSFRKSVLYSFTTNNTTELAMLTVSKIGCAKIQQQTKWLSWDFHHGNFYHFPELFNAKIIAGNHPSE